jgi:probable HAF family extracellular repeat protein
MNVILAVALTIHALALPPHATVDPFGARALMAVARDGTVAATTTQGGISTRAVVWNARGGWTLPPALPLPPAPLSVAYAIASFDGSGALLYYAAAHYGGTILATKYRSARLAKSAPIAIDVDPCATPRNSAGAVVAGTYADGDILATMESPPNLTLADLSGQSAPVAIRLRGSECTYLGNGIVLGTGGMYAAGYAGYFGNVPQSPDVSTKQRFVAIRWQGDERHLLGRGVALAVNASGVEVGADAPPGIGAAYNAQPHARMWPLTGSPTDLAPSAPLSVAYAIDDRGRVAGMLEDENSRHYAFVWNDGKLVLLDDLFKGNGWRFESAYAFTPDGGIAGIGIHNNLATAFVIEGL